VSRDKPPTPEEIAKRQQALRQAALEADTRDRQVQEALEMLGRLLTKEERTKLALRWLEP
jgi:hypothetical protein